MKVKQAKQQVASAKKSKKASSLSKPLGDQRSSISGEAKIKKKPSKSLQSRTLFTSETLKSQKPPESVPVVTSPVGTQKLASAVSPEQSSTQLSSSTEDEGKLPQGGVVNKGPPPELPQGIPVNIHQMITDLKEVQVAYIKYISKLAYIIIQISSRFTLGNCFAYYKFLFVHPFCYVYIAAMTTLSFCLIGLIGH